MYKCFNCNTLLTEFDVNFNQQLSRELPRYTPRGHYHYCFDCATKNRFENKAYFNSNRRIKYKYHLIPWIGLATILLAITIVVVLTEIFQWDDDVLQMFSSMLGLLVGGPCFFSWLICAWKLVKSFGDSYEMASQSWTTYHASSNSDGSVDVRKEDHYSSGGTSYLTLNNILLWVTYPLWSLPHLIYSVTLKIKVDLALLSKEVPKEMIDAYVFAYEQTARMKYPKLSKYLYECDKKDYIEKKEKLVHKYSLLGKAEEERQLDKIPLPYQVEQIAGKWYLLALLEEKNEQKRQNTYYYLLSETDGEVEGTILKNDYFVYFDKDWQDEWAELRPESWQDQRFSTTTILNNLDFYASKV